MSEGTTSTQSAEVRCLLFPAWGAGSCEGRAGGIAAPQGATRRRRVRLVRVREGRGGEGPAPYRGSLGSAEEGEEERERERGGRNAANHLRVRRGIAFRGAGRLCLCGGCGPLRNVEERTSLVRVRGEGCLHLGERRVCR